MLPDEAQGSSGKIHKWVKSSKSQIKVHKITWEGCPGGLVFRTPPANAGDTDWVRGPEGSHMQWGQLSPWATAGEATATRSPQTTPESSPHSPQLGKSLQSNQDRAAAAKALQLCLILCDPVDGSPPGSPVPGILQARTLEWVAIPFSNAWKWKVKVKSLSRVPLFATPWTAAYRAPPSMGFSRQECWMGCHCLLWKTGQGHK